jgi:hypothetical protein
MIKMRIASAVIGLCEMVISCSFLFAILNFWQTASTQPGFLEKAPVGVYLFLLIISAVLYVAFAILSGFQPWFLNLAKYAGRAGAVGRVIQLAMILMQILPEIKHITPKGLMIILVTQFIFILLPLGFDFFTLAWFKRQQLEPRQVLQARKKK